MTGAAIWVRLREDMVENGNQIYNNRRIPRNEFKQTMTAFGNYTGGTYTQKALMAAADLFDDDVDDGRIRQIILMTDGLATDDPCSPETVKAMTDKNIRVKVLAVGLSQKTPKRWNVSVAISVWSSMLTLMPICCRLIHLIELWRRIARLLPLCRTDCEPYCSGLRAHGMDCLGHV
eukprot:TRINITY_DN2301_c0_g1_i1.p1 TRINITY_DN2301_c0_g1~~TRINITY_DN2301_c0_g1_i1.p1  ORF type:complete len:176 (+),score=18.77 TRINITY_DN2301_c0_g1_i1:57-584(+)